MDPKADREPNYALWSFGPDQTEFKPVLKVRMSAPSDQVKYFRVHFQTTWKVRQ